MNSLMNADQSETSRASWSVAEKRILLTGASSGIGLAAALGLAKRGAQLVITTRNDASAKETAQKIHNLVPDAELDVLVGDLSIMSQVQRIAEEYRSRFC